MVSLLGELEGIFTTAESLVGRAFGAGAPLEAGFREIKGEGRTVDVARDVKRYGKYKDPKEKAKPGGSKKPKVPKRPKKPKDPEVLQPDVDMKDPGGGGGPKRKDPSNPEVKVPDADPPPKSFKPGDTPTRGWAGAMAYAARRRGRGRRSVKKYRGKKGSKGRRSVFKRYRSSKARGRRTSFRRKSRLNYRKAGKRGKQVFKRLARVEQTTGINTKLVRYVDYESMILRHRIEFPNAGYLDDAAMVSAGMFPFGYKNKGQKVFTLQKCLFGCERMIKAFDAANGSVANTDARTITFSDMYSDTTILNQNKHSCNLRLTKLIARRPKKTREVDQSGVAVLGTNNPDVHVYYNHTYHDHTDSSAGERLERLLFPEFKTAYSAPVSRDWKAVKSMTMKLDPGKSVQIKCKQRTFKCDREYLNGYAWPKGHCTWMIEAWGELCHITTEGASAEGLNPRTAFGVSSQGANGLLLCGDVTLDIMTKYHTRVSQANTAEKRRFVVNVPTTTSGSLQQIGIDMYQEIADDN